MDERFCNGHSGIITEIEHLKTETAKISTIQEAVIKLTILVDEIIKQKDEKSKENKFSFWDTATGKQLPWMITLVLIVLIASLVGTNLIELMKPANEIIPKP